MLILTLFQYVKRERGNQKLCQCIILVQLY